MMLRFLTLGLLALPFLPSQTQAQPSTGSNTEVLSDKAKLAKSTEHLSQMRQGLKGVLARLEEARDGKDVVKLNCVNEKLTNIKGLLRISEQANVALQESVAKREEQAAERESGRSDRRRAATAAGGG